MSDIFVDIEVEMVEFVLSEIGAAEGDFEGEAVDDIEVFPKSNLHSSCFYSGCAFSIFLDIELAVLEVENPAIF
jgi:hypothetical protein